KSFPIPPGIREEVHRQVEEKVRLGLWEPSDSSYRTQWFCVAKKDGKIRIVVNPDDMNRHTIRTTGQPPLPDQYCEHAAGCTIYTQLDLLSGYD
ncbi:DNA/RNA polymerase, partial [Hymenopellis radicata]